ncbi:hypothetical protein [Candidatus Neoehrlichia procyonis]|uniref:Uncharacterized protein n=1 Tax=Candidatus Neoehrlichia procyonis str. RAC413 TaxID=1359163 RepID=A0A0F3NMJ0_9RICK|nr:hypothetical protein [Candidatus Neoehrlichia lotoris]KJV69278.1 hypothetical protein NLO413_0662 [Candidatus Neoehrlichia lotoris str. RAC413]
MLTANEVEDCNGGLLQERKMRDLYSVRFFFITKSLLFFLSIILSAAISIIVSNEFLLRSVFLQGIGTGLKGIGTGLKSILYANNIPVMVKISLCIVMPVILLSLCLIYFMVKCRGINEEIIKSYGGTLLSNQLIVDDALSKLRVKVIRQEQDFQNLREELLNALAVKQKVIENFFSFTSSQVDEQRCAIEKNNEHFLVISEMLKDSCRSIEKYLTASNAVINDDVSSMQNLLDKLNVMASSQVQNCIKELVSFNAQRVQSLVIFNEMGTQLRYPMHKACFLLKHLVKDFSSVLDVYNKQEIKAKTFFELTFSKNDLLSQAVHGSTALLCRISYYIKKLEQEGCNVCAKVEILESCIKAMCEFKYKGEIGRKLWPLIDADYVISPEHKFKFQYYLSYGIDEICCYTQLMLAIIKLGKLCDKIREDSQEIHDLQKNVCEILHIKDIESIANSKQSNIKRRLSC